MARLRSFLVQSTCVVTRMKDLMMKPKNEAPPQNCSMIPFDEKSIFLTFDSL